MMASVRPYRLYIRQAGIRKQSFSGQGRNGLWLILVLGTSRGSPRGCGRHTMSVLLETSKGDIVLDLYVDDCPKACLNFLK